jgi:competence protein CoiA
MKIAHFAHRESCACQALAEGESEEHLLGKVQLTTFFKKLGYQVALEVWLPEIQQRPDLLLTRGEERLVIEYQCSSISLGRVAERTAGYRRLGLRVVWVLGLPYQNRKLTKPTLAKFAQVMKGELQITFWSTNRQQIFRKPWRTVDQAGKPQQITTRTLERQAIALTQALFRKDPTVCSWQRRLYEQGHNVMGIPWACHPRLALPGGAQEPQWSLCLRVLLALAGGSQNLVALLKVIQAARWLEIGAEEVVYVQKCWLMAVLKLWVSQGLIVIRQGSVSLNQPLVWYPDLQSKLGDRRG